jgi:serine/threonine-protein kinase
VVHAVGIVHRDFKPDNVMMVRDADVAGGERPKILDFGIAKLEFESTRFKTRTGAVMGTPLYMSPEQCNDSGKVDHRSDIYSLGCVLYHLLTGQPPFDIAGVGAVISAHMNETPERPSSKLTYLPPVIDQLVMRCLAKNPQERFANMIELQQACDLALAEASRWTPVPVAAHAAATIVDPGGAASRTTLGDAVGQASWAPGARSRKPLWIGIAAALVVLLGVGVGITVRMSGGGDEAIEVKPAASPPVVDQPEPVKREAAPPEPPAPEPKPEPVKTEPAPAPSEPIEKPVEKKTVPPKRGRPKPQPVKPDDLYDDRG